MLSVLEDPGGPVRIIGMLFRIDTVIKNVFSLSGKFIAIPGSYSKVSAKSFKADFLSSLKLRNIGYMPDTTSSN